MKEAATPLQSFPWEEADDMLMLLVGRAVALVDCVPGSDEQTEFDQLMTAIQAYGAKRRPPLLC